MTQFEYTFPAVRGIQAGRIYYTSMVPLHLLSKVFLFDEELPPDLRAQRTLSRARIPKIAEYITQNQDSYVLSALTASIDGELRFEAVQDPGLRNIGRLHVPMSAKFAINDGQHRRAAIEEAIKQCPALSDESIAVVFFADRGLARAQQMFTDLNQHGVKPSRSLALLYDGRSERAWLAREMASRVPIFRGRIELERSSIAKRSAKMFTLSALESATRALLADHKTESAEELAVLGAEFWTEVAAHMPAWQAAQRARISGGEFRDDYICAHGVALSALAHAGRALLAAYPESKAWRERLSGLDGLDWLRANSETWEGRATAAGRVIKSQSSVRLTAMVLRRCLRLPMGKGDVELEEKAGLLASSVLRVVK